MPACKHRRNPYRASTALILVSLLLAGCISSAGITPKAVKVDTQALQAGKHISSADKIAWPKQDWWTVYQDPQLNALVEKSIADSPNLRMAQARVALSGAYAEAMQASTKPNLNVEASAIRERFTALQFIPPPWAGNFDWNNKATAALTYDLDLWGRQESLWQGALDETRASAAEVQQVKLSLEAAVVRSYVQLAKEHALADIARTQQEEIEARIAIAKRGLAAGLGTQMEVMEAETPLPISRAQLDAIHARISLLHNQLAALTGQGPGAGDKISRPRLALNAAVGLPESLTANLIGRRPDILAQRWHVEAAQQHISSAKAEFYPDINLLSFIGFQALGFGQLISNAAAIGGVGPALSLPIFDGGRRRGKLSATTASYDIAVENYNETVIRALQDVSDQLLLLQSNARQRSEAEQSLTSASKAYQLAKMSYQAGLSNYQHVLDTHERMLHQQEIMVQLQANHFDGYAGLMRALGGGTVSADEANIDNTTAKPAQATP